MRCLGGALAAASGGSTDAYFEDQPRSILASGGEGRRDLAELIHRCWEEAVAMKSVSDYTASQGGEERGVTSFHPSKEDDDTAGWLLSNLF